MLESRITSSPNQGILPKSPTMMPPTIINTARIMRETGAIITALPFLKANFRASFTS